MKGSVIPGESRWLHDPATGTRVLQVTSHSSINHPSYFLQDLSSKDLVTSGRIWAEALQTAEALHDQFWIERVSGELAVIAFLKGDTATAVKLNARAFQIANELKDLQGEIRQKSLEASGR